MFEKILKSDKEKQRETDELVGLLQRSPEIQAQRQREKTEYQVKRRAAAQEIANAQAELAAVRPSLEDAVTKAAARVKQAEEDLKAAEHAHRVAVHEELIASIQCGERVNRAEGVLRQTADRRVDEFIREMDELLDKTRRGIFTIEKERSNWLGSWFHAFHSNAKTVNGQTETVRNIIARAEALKFQADADVEVELAKLRAEIPTEIPFAEYFEVPFASIPKSSGPIWTDAK